MKENFRQNKKRILFWGVLFIITLSMSISGIVLSGSGHGKIGSKRIELIPIAKKFNELDAVIKHGDLIATVKSDKLVVTETEKDYVYTYTLETMGTTKYLASTYDGKSKKTGDFVAFQLVDAIYKLNLGEDDLGKYYNLESFTESTVELGAQYKADGKKGTIFINIKGNIVNKMAGKIATIQEKSIITPNDLSEMFSQLEEKQAFVIEKGDTTIYIKDLKTTYDIYASFTDTLVVTRSLANVVGLLKPEVYDSLFDDNENIVFQYNSPAYKYYTNVTINETGIFKKPSGLYRIRLYK